MEKKPYVAILSRYIPDYSSINGRPVQEYYQQLFHDVDGFYYEEYYRLEKELVKMGVPRGCLTLPFFWKATLRPNSLLKLSFRSLPKQLTKMVKQYHRIVSKLPSELFCLHDELLYPDEEGIDPRIDVFVPVPDPQQFESVPTQLWDEYFFGLLCSNDEYEMSLEFLNEEDLNPSP